MATAAEIERAVRLGEGIRKAAGHIIRKGEKPPPPTQSKPDKPPGLRKIPVAEQRVMVKTKRTIQSQANRNKGTYDTYDPLSSIMTKQTAARKRKDAKAVTRTTRRISRRKKY